MRMAGEIKGLMSSIRRFLVTDAFDLFMRLLLPPSGLLAGAGSLLPSDRPEPSKDWPAMKSLVEIRLHGHLRSGMTTKRQARTPDTLATPRA